jgi:hypothetical protein
MDNFLGAAHVFFHGRRQTPLRFAHLPSAPPIALPLPHDLAIQNAGSATDPLYRDGHSRTADGIFRSFAVSGSAAA